MDQTYQLTLDDEGSPTLFALTAGTTEAARCQALQFAGELLRDRALRGSAGGDLVLQLVGPDGRLVYRIAGTNEIRPVYRKAE